MSAITHESNQRVVTLRSTLNKKRSHSMKVNRTIPVLLASFCAAALWAQQPTPPPPAHKMEMSGKPGMMDEKKMDESMMAHHKEMMAKMEAMDARLDELVKKMNAATGSKKPDAVAAVVNELVWRHVSTNACAAAWSTPRISNVTWMAWKRLGAALLRMPSITTSMLRRATPVSWACFSSRPASGAAGAFPTRIGEGSPRA